MILDVLNYVLNTLCSGTKNSTRGEVEVDVLDKVKSLRLTYSSLYMYFYVINSSWCFHILGKFQNYIFFELQLNN